jgi:hypothetical protein
MALTKAEAERGWQSFCCPEHGEIVAAPASSVVVCRCGRRASARQGSEHWHRDQQAKKAARQERAST